MRPHRQQPTRLPRPWDFPGKHTGVGCHFLLQCRKVKVKSLSRVWLLAASWTAAYQSPPSMGFSREEYWSGVPLPSPLTHPPTYLCVSYSSDSLRVVPRLVATKTSWWCTGPSVLTDLPCDLWCLFTLRTCPRGFFMPWNRCQNESYKMRVHSPLPLVFAIQKAKKVRLSLITSEYRSGAGRTGRHSHTRGYYTDRLIWGEVILQHL